MSDGPGKWGATGVHGKRLVYDTPTRPDHLEMQGEACFFLFGDRLYTADAVMEMDDGKEKMAISGFPNR